MSEIIWIDKETAGFVKNSVCLDRQREFNIANVIGDFISIKRAKQFAISNIKYSYLLQEHVFTKMRGDVPPYDVEHFYSYYYADHCKDVENAYRCLESIMPILNNLKISKVNRLIKFDEMKKALKLTFIDDIKLKVESNDSDICISYGTPTSSFSIITCKDSWFEYTCNTISDMVASVLHYYIVKDYKLVKCVHCQRYFATQTLKQKYCKRTSPYSNVYSQKESMPTCCEPTVRQTNQYLLQKRNRIDNKMRQSTKYQTQEAQFCYEFRDRCIEYTQKIKKEPTPVNFEAYNDYLEETEKEGRWKQ